MSAASQAPLAITGTHHLGLTIRDLGVSVPWYQQVFGATRLMEEAHPGGRAVILSEPQTQFRIGLHQHEANDGRGFAETQTGLDHFCWNVGSRRELERWQDRLDELRVEHSPIADHPYGSILVFRDPDHIQLEFYAPLASGPA